MPMIRVLDAHQRVASFAVDGALVTVEGLTVDCAAQQRDDTVVLEVRKGPSGPTLGGDGPYLATITIPAKRYVEQSSAEIDPSTGGPSTTRVAQLLDPDTIVITLWPAL